ncbi:MAG TPA: SRPBCC domain-containing protein [Methylomirabilota bacterium]|nr:SRPBCC domain-containing protein [Methylomirabilota bacterium]
MTPSVRWPPRYAPGTAAVHVRNELEMDAPVDAVWAWLIRAQLWPAWYGNSSDVTFLQGSPPDLNPGTRFRWRTFGVTLESTVLEFVPTERIAWDARAFGVDAYHAWVISTTPRGCHVLTEETQHGWLARLGHLVLPRRMHTHHQRWLEQLRDHAARGLPPRA